MAPTSDTPHSTRKGSQSHETPETDPMSALAPKTRQKGRKKKHPSRSDRCNDACALLSEAEDGFQSVSDAITAHLDETAEQGTAEASDNTFVPPDPETVTGWQSALASAESQREDAKSALEELKDEIDTWKDGMPENFQNGEKYQTLDSTSDTLDSACNQLDDTAPTLADTGDTRTDWEAVAEEVAHLADGCSGARGDAENAEFPGMFG